jgi:hypothetical protein
MRIKMTSEKNIINQKSPNNRVEMTLKEIRVA